MEKIIKIFKEKGIEVTNIEKANNSFSSNVYIISSTKDKYVFKILFNEEKQKYVDLLRQRCDIFKTEADECGLVYYPYKEGFFVTLKIEDDELLTKFHEAMLAQDIYTIKVNKGIRVALCSLSIDKCEGLAFKMKEILDSVK